MKCHVELKLHDQDVNKFVLADREPVVGRIGTLTLFVGGAYVVYAAGYWLSYTVTEAK